MGIEGAGKGQLESGWEYRRLGKGSRKGGGMEKAGIGQLKRSWE